MGKVNESVAPLGYKAVEKPAFGSLGHSICRECDWRVDCCSSLTNFKDDNHKCMSYAREDGESVIFKKKAQ